jgi:hypothetical protein
MANLSSIYFDFTLIGVKSVTAEDDSRVIGSMLIFLMTLQTSLNIREAALNYAWISLRESWWHSTVEGDAA